MAINGGPLASVLVREAVLVLALGPLVYYLAALWACLCYFRKETPLAYPRSGDVPPVSILKPVRGLDHQAYENFASFCRQNYLEYEVLFCVSSLRDPALPVVEKLQRDFPERRIRLLVGAPAIGTCDRLNKLCRLVKEASYGLLVISDSDIRVDSNYLRNVAAPFADPSVGAATVLFRSRVNGGLGSTLDAAGSAVEFTSGALLAEIGRFEAFASHSVDDYELGRRIAQQGYRVELTRTIVSMVYAPETLGQFLRHQLRWTIGLSRGLLHGCSKIRAIDPERTQVLGNFRLTYRDRRTNCRNYPWFARVFSKGHHEIENDPRVCCGVD